MITDSTRSSNTSSAIGPWNTVDHPTGIKRPSGRSKAEDYLTIAAALGHDHVQINGQINSDYVNFGVRLQEIIDPDFKFSGQRTRLSPNWFAIAFHVSLTVGRVMAGAKVALDLLNSSEHRTMSVPDILAKLGLSEHVGWKHRILEAGLRLAGLPPEVGAIIFGALRLNYRALWNPLTLMAGIYRLAHIVSMADGTIEDRARAILTTALNTLGEGNQSVYRDIGIATDSYLRWRASRSAPTAEHVLNEFSITGSSPERVRELYNLAVDQPDIAVATRPALDEMCPSDQGADLLVTSYALYERARAEQNTQRASELVQTANSLLALREQRDLLQPEFDEDRPQLPSDQDGRLVFKVITPLLRVHFGHLIWNYSRFNFWATQRNWGILDDRWPAIMAAFETLYREPKNAWDFPSSYTHEAILASSPISVGAEVGMGAARPLLSDVRW